MKVITRFAPSPTGYLHIGSARTALFNYLFAAHHGGKFLLRIEDTDTIRSSNELTHQLIDSLKWLDISWAGEPIIQSQRISRHAEVAHELLSKGKAYYCYASQAEINALREQKRSLGENFIFHSPWRDANPADAPDGVKPVIRLKTPNTGYTVVRDLLQGDVKFENITIDDVVLLKSDGSPTYMLAAPVDDHDMGITHIIRGDDHLNNAAKQQLIYEALGWETPQMTHIALIHDEDGAKLSKRRGAVGVEYYKDLGYLPEAINNYLLRLGFSHGDDEIISREQAIDWFSIDSLSKSSARLDIKKLDHLNSYYLRKKTDDELVGIILGKFPNLNENSQTRFRLALDEIRPRITKIPDLYDFVSILAQEYEIWKEYEEVQKSSKDWTSIEKIISDSRSDILDELSSLLVLVEQFDKENIKTLISNFVKEKGIKMPDVMMPLRALLTRKTSSISIFLLMELIGKDEVLKRMGEKSSKGNENKVDESI